MPPKAVQRRPGIWAPFAHTHGWQNDGAGAWGRQWGQGWLRGGGGSAQCTLGVDSPKPGREGSPTVFWVLFAVGRPWLSFQVTGLLTPSSPCPCPQGTWWQVFPWGVPHVGGLKPPLSHVFGLFSSLFGSVLLSSSLSWISWYIWSFHLMLSVFTISIFNFFCFLAKFFFFLASHCLLHIYFFFLPRE